MKSYLLLVVLYASIDVLVTFTDPSIVNPQLLKRFEYKLSFKGPHLVFKDGSIPFWTHGGSTIASNEQIRITPSIKSQKGWIWTKNQLNSDSWLLEIKLRVNGRGRLGADGMAIWFTESAGIEGPVFGSNDHWKGLGIFLDSYDNDDLAHQSHNNPLIGFMVNDGTLTYDHERDGIKQLQGSCIRDFRNKPYPIGLKIEYINKALSIYLNNGISHDDNAFELCTRVDGIELPKAGYLGVTAATGGLADDHDVLEFLTNTYVDKKTSGQNQAATDEQSKKYQEEYAKFEQELKKQQEEYQKDHPDATTPMSEDQLFESEYDREFRTILEGQDQIRNSLSSIDHKMLELLGRIERLSLSSGGQQAGGQASGNIPNDVARVQDINRVISANSDMSRIIQSYAKALTDIQQQVNRIQLTNNQGQAGSAGQPATGSNFDTSALNEIRDTVRGLKSDSNAILQKSGQPVKCQGSIGGDHQTSCVSPMVFYIAIIIQLVVLIGYFTYANRQDRLARKYL